MIEIQPATFTDRLKTKAVETTGTLLKNGRQLVDNIRNNNFNLDQIKRVYTTSAEFAEKMLSSIPENSFVSTLKKTVMSELLCEGLLYTTDHHAPVDHREDLRTGIQTVRIGFNGIRFGNALGRVPGFRDDIMIPFRYLAGGLAAYYLTEKTDYRRLTNTV